MVSPARRARCFRPRLRGKHRSHAIRRHRTSRFTASPGNIILVGGAPVTLAIPDGQDGLTLSEGSLAMAWSICQNGNEGSFLFPEQRSHSPVWLAQPRFQRERPPLRRCFGLTTRGSRRKAQLGGVVAVQRTNYHRQQNGSLFARRCIHLAYFFGDDLGPLMTDTVRHHRHGSRSGIRALRSDCASKRAPLTAFRADEVDNTNIADSGAVGWRLPVRSFDSVQLRLATAVIRPPRRWPRLRCGSTSRDQIQRRLTGCATR